VSWGKYSINWTCGGAYNMLARNSWQATSDKNVIEFTTITRGLNGVVFLAGVSYIVWYTSCVVSRLDWRLL
jgi:hypothetical protein